MKKLLYILAAIIAFSAYAYAETITTSITTATHRVDNTSMGLSEIKGHNMYCGASVGTYPDKTFFAGATLPDTQIIITDLGVGTHYCVFTTVDIDDRESAFSAGKKTFIVDGKALPKFPTVVEETIRITITLP